jgi:radical SAM superfamily enzyme YgiQ (UPF0313 family)
VSRSRHLVLINPSQSFAGFSGHAITRYPPLGLAYIAALTPSHWKITLQDENFDAAGFVPCDLVGITVMTPQAPRAYEIAALFRRHGVPVVLGGIHPSMRREEALQYADVVVAGEADDLWPRVIDDFERGALQRIYENTQEIDLSRLVVPAHHLFDKRYRWGTILTTRGCPMHCEFCSVTAYNGFRYRTRPVDQVIDELAAIPQRFVFFADDNMAGYSKSDARRFVALCRAMVERGIRKRWITQVAMTIARDEECLRWAAQAGCMALFIGIESLDRAALSGMDKKMNIAFVERIDTIARIHRAGLAVIGSFIVGNETDTPGIFDRIHDYVEHTRIDIPTVSFMVPFPGTRLESRLARQNRLNYRDFPADWAYYNIGNRAMIDTPEMQRHEYNREMKRLIGRLFMVPAMLRRAWHAFLTTRSPLIAIALYSHLICYPDSVLIKQHIEFLEDEKMT